MLFLLNAIRRNIFLVIIIIVGLSYAGINLPFMASVEDAILGWVDTLGKYVDLKNIGKQATDAINNIKKYF